MGHRNFQANSCFVRLSRSQNLVDMAQKLLSNLNPQQKQAVQLPEVSSLILAGAGSGKTSVLVSRIAYILENRLATPNEILAVTFTNKAAKEMLGRLQTKIRLNARAMWVGTFHGLCNRFLRQHYKAAGLNSTFPILDNTDQLSLVKRVMKDNDVSEEEIPARKIQNFINRRKEDGIRASDFRPEGFQERKLLDMYKLYEKRLVELGAVDFPELILRTYEVLMKNENIRNSYVERFRFILVDEFQDTNLLQYKLIKAFSGFYDSVKPNAVFAVGDDDQSIYSFRGARVENMNRFLVDYKIPEPIRLEQNYRSQGNILEAANHLISVNKGRLGKNLWTDAGKGEPIKGYESDNEKEEAAFVTDTIKELLNNGEDMREIAVLYRSNAQSRALEDEFLRRNIKYMIYGGLRFYERAEIKNSLAYLRLAENPNDDAAFQRIVNVPPRKIGAKTVEDLGNMARSEGISLLEAAQKTTGAMAKKLAPFLQIIWDIKQKMGEYHLPDLVEYANNRSGLIDMYDKDDNGIERIENLNELINAARAFLKQENIVNDIADDNFDNLTPLSQFLSQATLEAGENQAKTGEKAVQLMTVHASKGLEFNNVFVTGLEEGLFPHMNSLYEPNGVEEERRLMYVAVTRARKRLYLSLAASRFLNGDTRYNIRSQFLKDIPEECVQWLKVISKQQALEESENDEYGGLDSWGMRRNWSSRGRFGASGYKTRLPDTDDPFDLSPNRSRDRGGFGSGFSSKPTFHSTNTPDWAKELLSKASKMAENKLRAKVSQKEKYQIGSRVKHEKFGAGTVVKYTGDGDAKKIQIRFDNSGTKEMLYIIVEKKLSGL